MPRRVRSLPVRALLFTALSAAAVPACQHYDGSGPQEQQAIHRPDASLSTARPSPRA